MATFLARLLPLLLLMLPLPLREFFSTSHHRQPTETAAGGLHPIVLIPGVSCPAIEARLTDAYQPSDPRCGAMKGKGWFGLWETPSEVLDHDYVECFSEQMSLVYDPVANDYRNIPGVETRVPGFGWASGFYYKQPVNQQKCLVVLREALESIGYRDGDTLLGAPYDLRYTPPVPGQPSEVFSAYFDEMTKLLEDASKRSNGRKVIIFGHSYGGEVALEFVKSKPLSWRHEHIKHLILVAPTLPEGLMGPLNNLISGTEMLYVPTITPLSLRPTWRSFETAMANLPSKEVFGHRPLVVTKERNYTAYDFVDLLKAIGFGDGIEPYERRALPRTKGFEAPLVPVTCIYGVSNMTTPWQLVFWDGDFDATPEILYGDGDGIIGVASMVAFVEKMKKDPGQKEQFKSVWIEGAGHSDIVTTELALPRVMHEIHEANRI